MVARGPGVSGGRTWAFLRPSDMGTTPGAAVGGPRERRLGVSTSGRSGSDTTVMGRNPALTDRRFGMSCVGAARRPRGATEEWSP